MALQPVKFYQTGTFTVGNRLLGEETRSVQANMRRTNSLNSGHRACQGCGEALGARYAIDAAMQATGNKSNGRQCDRLSGSFLNSLPGIVLANPVDPFAVRQCLGRRFRRGSRLADEGALGRPGHRARW